MSPQGGWQLAHRDLLHRLVRAIWDCVSWIGASLLVVGARYDFDLHPLEWDAVVAYIGLACGLQIVVGAFLMLYRGRYRNASFEESIGLAASVILVAVLLGIGMALVYGLSTFPRAMAVLVPPIALMLMAAGRWGYRARRTYLGRLELDGTTRERTLIYGAGDAGYELARLIGYDSGSHYDVVGFIDDAPFKRNLRLAGVPVLGNREQLVRVAREQSVSTVILAIARASAPTIREVSELVEGAGLNFRVLPPMEELLGRNMSLSDIREVEITDLLGRRPVKSNIHAIAGYLTNRVVLVTGAGGSIGSELARQIHRFGPKELVLLDRDESALHGVQLSLYGKGLLDTPDMVLCDIRDVAALNRVFEQHRPEVVFHAAALKHLPMLEQYPDEGWKTNVLGSLNILRASQRYGSQRLVNVSTDKAADPTSVLGKTKRLAERMTAWFALNSEGVYVSVRFGNVLGSRGSVLHTFTQQIHAGGPITVTHPDITRYFMTIPEACELTIQAGAIGEGAEVMVLDMGEPVRILDVAEQLIERAGRPVEIVFTGLRSGEKLHEVLMSMDERGDCKYHPRIRHVSVAPLDPAEIDVMPPSTIAYQDGSSYSRWTNFNSALNHREINRR